MKSLSAFTLLVVLIAVPSDAQTVLTLEKCLSLAFRQSYLMQNAIQQYHAARRNYQAQALAASTSVDLSLQLPNYSESLTNQFNPLTERYEFYQLQSTVLRSTLSVDQPVRVTGGTISMSGDFFKRNQLSGLSGASQTTRDYFSYFQIALQQPLLAPNVMKLGVERASLQVDEAFAEFQRNALDIAFQVTDAFYTAYRLSQQKQISAEQVKQNEESYETATSKFGAGLIPEVEMLQTDVDLVTSRNQLLNDQREATRSANALELLLGLPIGEEVALSADLHHVHLDISPDTAIAKALRYRSELLNARRDIDIADMGVEMASSQRHLRVDLTASYGLNRNDTEIQAALRDFGRTRAVALAVSVPLFDWGRHALEVEAAEAQKVSAELTYANTEQQIRQEILEIVSGIAVAESRIQVLEKSVDVAQKSYDISIERFQAGTITRNDLAQAQQRLTNSKLNSLIALIDYRTGLANLARKTLWNFEKNEPVTVEVPEE